MRFRQRLVTALVLGGATIVAHATAAAAAAAVSPVALHASIDGRGVVGGGAVPLHPVRTVQLDLQLTSTSSQPIEIGTVQLIGRVAGLEFFEYDTLVDVTLGGRATTTLDLQLDLRGLGHQATGLIPASVRVLDDNGHVLGEQRMLADVRGSLWSVYGLFGLALALLTGLGVAGILLGVARHTLSPRRWRRVARFAWPGIGLGLVIVFTLSALRVWAPDAPHALWSVLASTAAMCVVGALAPEPRPPVAAPPDDIATRVTIGGDT